MRLRIDQPGGTILKPYPVGTAAGDYRYWVEDANAATVFEQMTPALISDAFMLPPGSYTGFAARQEAGGAELPNSRVSATFTVVETADIEVPQNVVVDLS